MLKTQKSKQTRAKILQISKDVFAEKGFNQTTVKDVTQAAGLGYGTFYLYFKDKKDVFYALVEQVEDELYTASKDGSDIEADYARGISSYRALRKDLRSIFQSFRNNSSVLKFSKELAVLDPSFAKRYEAMRARLIQRTKNILQKSTLENVDYDVAAVAIAGMIESVANEWNNHDSSSSLKSDAHIEAILPTVTKLYFKAVS
jgi:AcrR family transcriptional regulator